MDIIIRKFYLKRRTKNYQLTMGASVGDTFTCFRKHENAGAVQSGTGRLGMGRDLDDAVLAATNRSIAANQGLVNIVALSF